MVKNWTKILTACASRACEILRLNTHPSYAPKTNPPNAVGVKDASNNLPRMRRKKVLSENDDALVVSPLLDQIHKEHLNATETDVPQKLSQTIQAWRKTRPQEKPPYPPHERRHKALTCDVSTPFTASVPRAVVSHSQDPTPWLYL